MNLPSCKPGMTFFTSHSATPSMARLRPRNQRMGKGHWEEQRVNALISWLQQYDLICRSIAWTQCKMQNSFNNINNYIYHYIDIIHHHSAFDCICIQDLIQKKYYITRNLDANCKSYTSSYISTVSAFTTTLLVGS